MLRKAPTVERALSRTKDDDNNGFLLTHLPEPNPKRFLKRKDNDVTTSADPSGGVAKSKTTSIHKKPRINENERDLKTQWTLQFPQANPNVNYYFCNVFY